MKVALAHKRLDKRGGTELDFYRTATGLRDLGHEIHLFCSEFAIDPPAGTHAHFIPIVPLGRTARLWSFANTAPKIMRSYPCDVVVSFGRMISQDVVRSGGGSHRAFLQKFGKEGGLRRRIWHHLSPYHQSLLALERRQFQPGHYKRILAVSEDVKRELLATYAIREDRITVIHNGVDEKRFHFDLRDKFRTRIRNQCHIPLDAPTVLFVGSGFRRKGLDRLLKAWNSPQMKDAYLVVVGDDAQRARYEALATERAKGKIIFVGRRDDVESFYGAADLLALPAVQEAFGNVVLEALAAGLPTVVSQVVGASEILKGKLADGIVVHPEDPKELVTKLLAMLERGRHKNFTLEARELAEAYSWSNHFSKLEIFLKETIEQNGWPSSS
ncbi:MAG TPA: glycosyltransferase family 4 protein [Candidatus Binatia bacterium]|nr:glycosyltransferase family 4 protein [Candidatus Binatia bacterium]